MNLYVHFPFCRRKCAYCALFSRAGSTPRARSRYVARIANEIRALGPRLAPPPHTVYFGGGTPALCDLDPLFAALRETGILPAAEFTVELHPEDATEALLALLVRGGVTRVSMGFQATDDATLAAMGRSHTVAEAEAAFRRVQRFFPNAGLDLIVGYPRVAGAPAVPDFSVITHLMPAHASVYTLIREPKTRLDLAIGRGTLTLPDDDAALAEYAALADVLTHAGLVRYEISNWARTGCACRHNQAVWRGEDYVGLGEGAYGREGCVRTRGEGETYVRETITPEADALERVLFALRTRDGLNLNTALHAHPVLESRRTAWRSELDFAVSQGLARVPTAGTYVLTPRGYEVCDAILSELV